MSTAFALTLAHLGEHTRAADTAGAFAAYITGNAASNLFGLLLAAGLADQRGPCRQFPCLSCAATGDPLGAWGEW